MTTTNMKLGWLALLALLILILPYGRSKAHEPAQEIEVPVTSGWGWDVRAACDDSESNGNWTFAITAVSGKVSRVDVRIYANAHPTDLDGELRQCAAFQTLGVQNLCFQPDPDNPGQLESVGSVTIHKPRVGKQGALSLPAGIYCVRATVFGKGSATVSLLHP